jgi:hypothetical protein
MQDNPCIWTAAALKRQCNIIVHCSVLLDLHITPINTAQSRLHTVQTRQYVYMAHYVVIKEYPLDADYNHMNLLSGYSNELKRSSQILDDGEGATAGDRAYRLF